MGQTNCLEIVCSVRCSIAGAEGLCLHWGRCTHSVAVLPLYCSIRVDSVDPAWVDVHALTVQDGQNEHAAYKSLLI